MEKENKLHVYTGDGKGKTTASMGLALRMLGYGKQVLIVQFMKHPNSGELKALQQLPGAHIHQGATMNRFTYQMDEEELQRTKREQTAEVERIIEEIHRIQPALTVLDELAVAIANYLVPREDAFRLIDEALKTGEVVVTGRGASEALMDKADYVSVIQAKKHPFNEGLPARKGIEW